MQANLFARDSHYEENILREAAEILYRRISHGDVMDSPQAVRKFLQMRLAGETSEKFGVLLLNSKHRVITFLELFQGTINQAHIHPREVVKAVIQHNAAAVILVHNHPSGSPEPSKADMTMTARLKEALALIEVRTLDHVVVGTEGTVSLAERGLI